MGMGGCVSVCASTLRLSPCIWPYTVLILIACGLCRPECARSDWERHCPICNTLRRILRSLAAVRDAAEGQQGCSIEETTSMPLECCGYSC